MERCKGVQILWISRNLLQNEYLVVKIGVDTAENEPFQIRLRGFQGPRVGDELGEGQRREVRHPRRDVAERRAASMGSQDLLSILDISRNVCNFDSESELCIYF